LEEAFGVGGALGNVIWKGWKKNGDDEGAEAAKMVILLHENVSIMDREEEVEEVRMLETADLLKEWVSTDDSSPCHGTLYPAGAILWVTDGNNGHVSGRTSGGTRVHSGNGLVPWQNQKVGTPTMMPPV
jgi:hypothetical protein